MSNPGGINLNLSPYYDDYDEDKKFVRILFRPGRAVQARELTQLQTIFQKQIERFGNYFFRDGTIIDGCEQGLDLNLPYVKLQTTHSSNTVNVASFLNKDIVGASTGIRAKVGLVADAEVLDPKTLFINYISSGSYILTVNTAPSTLVSGASITTANGSATIDYWDTNLSKIFVSNVSGTFSATEVASTVNNTNTTIYILVSSLSDKRESKEYENNETLFTLETIRSYANSATTQATSTTVGSTTYTRGSKITIGDGILYVANHFIKNSAQTLILDKYTNTPSYKVGFVPEKTFVSYIQDIDLVDNAQGTPNYQAPGADRFKIDTVLTKLELDTETGETEFISLVEIDGGNIKKKKSFGLEGKLEEVLSKRTYEESGDYTLSNPKLNVREHLLQGENGGRFPLADGGNTNLLLVEVDPFVAYVKGFRNEFISKQNVNLTKGLDVQQIEQNKTQINYGNYVEVTDVVGSWDVMTATKVDLYNVPFLACTNRSFANTTVNTSNKIGEARVRSIEYVSGTVGAPNATYRMYLFDVVMSSGSFENVRGIYDPVSTGFARYADVVLSGFGTASLKEASFNNAIFQLPYDAVKTIRDVDNNIESGFTFKKEFSIGFTISGTVTVSSGDNNETFVGTGVLSSTQKNANYILIPDTTANTANLTGSVTTTSGSPTVSGTGFSSRITAGEYLVIGSETHRVLNVNSDTSLTLANNHGSSFTGGYYKTFPAGTHINLSGLSGSNNGERTVEVIIPGSTSVQIQLKETFTAPFNAKLISNLNRANAREMKKALQANTQVQIQANTHPNGLFGPYSLGRADLYKIRGIYQSSSFSAVPTTANTNVTGLYTVDNGQRDNTYEHITITPKLGVVPTGRLLVVFDYFDHDTSQGVGYMSADSYPIDDVNESSTTINTSEIPVYISKTNGYNYNLRNCLDFRLRKKDDAANTVNPFEDGTYKTPVGGLHIPKPLSDFDSDLSVYKGRISKLFLNENGEFGITDGSPGYPTPQIPPSVPGTLDLAVINVPPYPSEPRNVVIEPQKNRRYTMRDIGKIEDRVNRLEYYTSLNLLEKQASDLSILDESGIDRFKNGILVDPYIGHNIADVSNPDLVSSISRTDKFVTSQVDVTQVPLKLNTSNLSGVTKTNGNKLMLTYTDEVFSRNPYASAGINLSQQLTYDWTGVLQIYPSTDNWFDQTNYPGRNLVVDLEGTSDNWRQISNAWETEYDAIQTRWIGTAIQQDAASSSSSVGRIFNVSSSDQYDSISSSISVGPTETQSQARVVDVSVNHFMRSRDYVFSAKGLKPGSKLYAFLDGVDVSNSCVAIYTATGKTLSDVAALSDKDGFIPDSALTYSNTAPGLLFANSKGEIDGIFTLPAQSFNIGQREFKLTDDVENRDTAATTTSKALIISQGISLVSTSSHINTRPLNVNFSSLVEKSNVSREIRTSTNVNSVTRDPLSQSFFVDDVNYPYGTFLTKIDIFFKTKSSNSNKKVFMQIREMENGLPTRKVFGDSTTFVTAGSITMSATGTEATTFTFDNPVFLLPGNEYCFSLIPEGNTDEFEIWIAELGQFDVSGAYSQQRIEKQPAAGILFTTSNDYSWSVRQSQDVKYTMYVANYSTTSSGTAYLQNVDLSSDTAYSHIVNNISFVKPDRTTLSLDQSLTDSSSLASSYFNFDNLELLKLNGEKSLLDSAQEVSNSVKSVSVRTNLQTTNKYISPFIDLERIQSIVYSLKVNNSTEENVFGFATVSSSSNVVSGYSTQFLTDITTGDYVYFGGVPRKVASVTNNQHLIVTTNFVSSSANVAITKLNEEKPSGPYASQSRYITRRVELADGFEANDLNVYVDVNRPGGTDIKVYYKVLSSADNDSFDDKFYQEMTLIGVPIISENQENYYEEKYVVPDSVKTGGTFALSGTVSISSGSATVTGTSTRFLEELKIGDTIQIATLTKVVSAIANNVSLTADSTYSTNSSGQTAQKILNNSIVYVTPDNRSYSGYKYFSIKVVFLSNDSSTAPRIKRLRAIALT